MSAVSSGHSSATSIRLRALVVTDAAMRAKAARTPEPNSRLELLQLMAATAAADTYGDTWITLSDEDFMLIHDYL